MVGRAFVIWLTIIALETLHGLARVAWLEPHVGDFRARQICVFTGSALIVCVALASVRWMQPRRIRDVIVIGAMWVALTVAFELALGRWVAGMSWTRLLSDYDVTRGGWLGFGLLAMFLAPWWAARQRRLL